MKFFQHLFWVLFVVMVLVFSSCRKDEPITDSSARLGFSVDTVMFDTIFTSFGSTTKQFKVYNRHDQPINISSLYLAKGDNSSFRMNVNGFQSNHLEDIEIAANDSFFVFVEVTIEPGRDEMVEQDSIVFSTNGNIQDIDLVAFGQDVNLLVGDTILTNTTWTNDKPYLVYYYVIVDSLVTLTIEQGTQIHFHKNALMWVKGSLQVNGALDMPVVFQGDRLEDLYDDVPGQWDRLLFGEGSTNNYMDYSIVKNASIGIQLGTLSEGQKPSLLFTNSRIEHMSYTGIYSVSSGLVAMNSVIADCGYYAIACLAGGYYEFYHCTVANYWGYATRNDPSVILSNNLYAQGNYYLGDLQKAYFVNCIIDGSLENELILSNDNNAAFSYMFRNTMIKAGSEIDTNAAGFSEVIWNGKPNFIDYRDSKYELDTLSEAKDAGTLVVIDSLPVLGVDYYGISRTADLGPDLGPFEREE